MNSTISLILFLFEEYFSLIMHHKIDIFKCVIKLNKGG